MKQDKTVVEVLDGNLEAAIRFLRRRVTTSGIRAQLKLREANPAVNDRRRAKRRKVELNRRKFAKKLRKRNPGATSR